MFFLLIIDVWKSFLASTLEPFIIRRKNIGFVFQFHHLIQEFSALENTIFPLLFDGTSKKTAIQKGQNLLEKVGLGKRMNNRQLSYLEGSSKESRYVERL
jgi:lipoprotein-releasing system ATP-binding protein